MKKLVILLMFVCLFATPGVFAADEVSSSDEFAAVESWDFDLQIETQGRKINLEWTPFSGNEDFLWYKFVYSTTDSDPVYPNDGNKFLGGEAALSDAELYLHAEDYYVRLCAVTQREDERGRYCGEVHFLEYEGETRELQQVKNVSATKVVGVKKVEAVKNKTVENKEAKEAKEEEAPREEKKVDDELKAHIDDRLESFVNGLSEAGYTNSEIVDTLNTVISRLERYKEIEGYARIATYVQDVLEHYKAQYGDDIDIFNEIFSEF